MALIIIAGTLIVAYIAYNKYGGNKDIKKEKFIQEETAKQKQKYIQGENGSLDDNKSMSSDIDSNIVMDDMNNSVPVKEDLVKYFPKNDFSPPETSSWLKQKFEGRNRATNGYKRSSYSGSVRGNLGSDDWKAYFDHNNNVVGNSQTGDNDKFLPFDETNGGYAVFKGQGRATCGSNQNCEPEDLFNPEHYLPQEVNDDWFSVQKEPISVKNRHLINITKPIGVDTIGSSLKNAWYDIRGGPANPKFVVSPWLQSSTEPDTNLKPLY